MRTILCSMLVAMALWTGCGESACDVLKDTCDACNDPGAKVTCKAHARSGNEDLCEFDLDAMIFEQACEGAQGDDDDGSGALP